MVIYLYACAINLYSFAEHEVAEKLQVDICANTFSNCFIIFCVCVKQVNFQVIYPSMHLCMVLCEHYPVMSILIFKG